MPTECIPDLFGFKPVGGREVVAAFDAGAVTSDAGALLLSATDRAIRMMDRFAACFHDVRCQEQIEHEVVTLVGQRVFGIALGYEDLNDHDELRHDPMMAVLAGKLEARREDCAPASPAPFTPPARGSMWAASHSPMAPKGWLGFNADAASEAGTRLRVAVMSTTSGSRRRKDPAGEAGPSHEIDGSMRSGEKRGRHPTPRGARGKVVDKPPPPPALLQPRPCALRAGGSLRAKTRPQASLASDAARRGQQLRPQLPSLPFPQRTTFFNRTRCPGSLRREICRYIGPVPTNGRRKAAALCRG
jgi:hypothetical protein